jgi:hypothetical protein
MKQPSNIGKYVLHLFKAYWRWVNQVADNQKIPEHKLNEMVQKRQFKTPEEAERATKRTMKGVLVAIPFIFLSILIWGILPKSENQSVVVQPTESPNSPQPEQSTKSSTPFQPNSSDQSSQITTLDFRSFLPPENEEIRNFILSDPWLGGFLQNVWIGYVTKADLIDRGFYINVLYKHTWEGEGSAATAKGACSPIGFNGAFICGRGMMQAYQWGIQSDEAIRRLNILEEQWAKR